jgi:hypothetical protein
MDRWLIVALIVPIAVALIKTLPHLIAELRRWRKPVR